MIGLRLLVLRLHSLWSLLELYFLEFASALLRSDCGVIADVIAEAIAEAIVEAGALLG